MNLVDVVNKDHMNPNVSKFPEFRSGDTINVDVKIVEIEVAEKKGSKNAKGEKLEPKIKHRIQSYQGVVIDIKNKSSINGHFVVRKISNGIGVERVFPFHSPNIASIEIVSRGKSRRAKHYYLRDLEGKAARIDIDYARENADANAKA
jgi:large subunit ribosomal protein L19